MFHLLKRQLVNYWTSHHALLSVAKIQWLLEFLNCFWAKTNFHMKLLTASVWYYFSISFRFSFLVNVYAFDLSKSLQNCCQRLQRSRSRYFLLFGKYFILYFLNEFYWKQDKDIFRIVRKSQSRKIMRKDKKIIHYVNKYQRAT